MKKLTLFVSLILGSASTVVSAEECSPASALTSSINAFGLDFYQQQAQDKSCCFSPYSLFQALSMTYMGSDGQTKEAMEEALHLKEFDPSLLPAATNALRSSLTTYQGSCELREANALWVQEGTQLSPNYEESLSLGWQAPSSSVNFSDKEQSAQVINSWIQDITGGLISTLFTPDSFSDRTRLVLTNALAFKGSWAKPFLKKNTHKRRFYFRRKAEFPAAAADKTLPYINPPFVLVDMMQQAGRFPYYEDEALKFLLLPLGTPRASSSYACFFVLPKGPLKNLEKILANKAPSSLANLASPRFVDVLLPVFTVEHTCDPAASLQKLGMGVAFTSSADFSKLCMEEPLQIDKVLHKTLFSLHEGGVCAAAATGVSMGLTCIGAPAETVFHARRPFLFGIIDLNSHLVLFLGKYTGP